MQTFTWQQFYWYLLLLLALLVVTVGLTQWPLTPAAQAQRVTAQVTLANSLAVTLATSALQPGQQSAINATLRDPAGQPIADQLVVFYGGLGTVSPASAVTDTEGRVNATYTAGNRGGQAQVTVLAGYASHTVPIQIAGTGGQPSGKHKLYLPPVMR